MIFKNAWRCILAGAMLSGALTVAPVSNAQDYPTRPVKILIPYAAGGMPDTIGRLVAEELSQRLGKPFIVENRPGASGYIGVNTVINAQPDGYTLLLGATGTLSIGPSVYSQVPFKSSDLAPISLICDADYVLLSQPALKGKTLAEIIALAQKNPGQFKVASSGFGSESHLLIELIKLAAGMPLTHVPYKGFSFGVTDVMGDRVELIVASIAASAQLVNEGKIGAVAVTGMKRSPQLPDAPTFGEAGYPGVRMTSWLGLLTSAQTPEPIVRKLSETMEQIVHSSEFGARLAKHGLNPMAPGAAAFAEQLRNDTAQYADIVARANIPKMK